MCGRFAQSQTCEEYLVYLAKEAEHMDEAGYWRNALTMKLPLAPEAETVVYSATGYLRAVLCTYHWISTRMPTLRLKMCFGVFPTWRLRVILYMSRIEIFFRMIQNNLSPQRTAGKGYTNQSSIPERKVIISQTIKLLDGSFTILYCIGYLSSPK